MSGTSPHKRGQIMRILETTEIDQVSGAGLLGLNLNLGVLDILGIHAGVAVGG